MKNKSSVRDNGKYNDINKIALWKKCLVGVESLVILVYLFMSVMLVWFKVDRNGFLASMSSNPIVRFYLNHSQTRSDYDKNVLDSDYDEDKIKINDDLSGEVEEYMNIALFGIDSRGDEFDDSAHSDTIIIVSINNKTGEVKMSSVYRDTMLKIVDSDGDVSYTKANAAFFKNGPECAINMLNTNLDLNITDYAVVNFNGLANIIDALGGIEVNITQEEMVLINGYLTETRKITGMDAPDISQYGNGIHLNGLQATAYCRIRYVAFHDDDGTVYNNDMGRTARQRSVIQKVVQKAKTAGVSQVMAIAKQILNSNTEEEKFVGTSLSFNELMDLIPTLLDFNITGSEGFPYTYTTPTINGASMVVGGGLAYNVQKLHEYLFSDEVYSPSATVQTISDYIENYSGVPTIKLDEDKETADTTDTSSSSYSGDSSDYNY